MKKILAVLLAISIIFCFTACKSKSGATTAQQDAKASEKQNNPDTAAKQKPAKQVVKMATTADFPPFENLENGEFVGADIDMIRAICDKLDLELEITNVADFDAMLNDVAGGKYDIGVSGITADENRKKILDFTDPYYKGSQSVIVAADSEITTLAGLDEIVISCQRGTTGEKYIIDNGYAIQSYKTGEEAVSALVSGKVDAVVIDDAVARTLSKKQDGATRILPEPLTEEEYAIALKPGSDELTQKFNGAIKELKEDGTLAKIFEKYKLVISE